MAQLFRNNAFSSLAASINSVVTTLTVASGEGDRFPVVAGADFAMVTLQDSSNNIEIVRITARTSGADAMTILRAQEGTTARSWALGDIVELRVTAFGVNPLSVLAGAATEAAIRAALLVPTRTGGDASGTWNIAISGNAATATLAASATVLQTARTINGTSFNGSANITTANWGTSRTITIGVTGKAVTGAANVSWSLAEIGAAAVGDTVNLTGDQTKAGVLTLSSVPVVPNDSFTFAKLQNIATARILGRSTASSGDIEELTLGANLTLAAGVLNAVDGVPAGAVTTFARNSAPTGWLKANGAAVSRTTYATLFAAIGTTFGTGDGSTTFNLPDLRGEFIRGWDDSRGVDSGRVFGSAQSSQNLAHTHTPGSGGAFYTTVGGSGLFGGGGIPVLNDPNTSSSGGAEARPRNVALLACIKF